MASFRRRIKFKKKVNIKRVVGKLATTLIVLYAGGYVINEIGDVLNGTALPFNQGFALLGWTFNTTAVGSSATNCVDGASPAINWGDNCIVDYQGTGILTVVGIVGIASVILEFVQFKL